MIEKRIYCVGENRIREKREFNFEKKLAKNNPLSCRKNSIQIPRKSIPMCFHNNKNKKKTSE